MRNLARDCTEEIRVCVKRGEESAKKTVNCAETKELRLAPAGDCAEEIPVCVKRGEERTKKQLIALKRRNCAKPVEECAENIPV